MAREYQLVDRLGLDKEYNSFVYVRTLKNEYNLDESIFYDLLPLEKLTNFFNVDKQEVIKVIKSMLGINLNLSELFSYTYRDHVNGTLSGKNLIKVSDSTVYYMKENWSRGNLILEKKLCDVYIIANDYYASSLNMVFIKMFQEKYPSLFDSEKYPFLFHKENIFTEEQKKELNKIVSDTEIKEIHYSLIDFPISLIAECITNREKINESYFKSNITLYFDSKYIFIKLFEVSFFNKRINKHFKYDRTLYIPVEFFKTKDWSLVENVTKYGEAYEDNAKEYGIDFLEQRQGDADYFKTEIVEKIKEALLSL